MAHRLRECALFSRAFAFLSLFRFLLRRADVKAVYVAADNSQLIKIACACSAFLRESLDRDLLALRSVIFTDIRGCRHRFVRCGETASAACSP